MILIHIYLPALVSALDQQFEAGKEADFGVPLNQINLVSKTLTLRIVLKNFIYY